jgi:hypothetical protein
LQLVPELDTEVLAAALADVDAAADRMRSLLARLPAEASPEGDGEGDRQP